jgi:hypothetical protein
MFNWRTFLGRNRIEYIETGANVARGNINIRCPFCGTADESGHMGLSESGKGWGCWRSARHRGRAPERLVAALLRISWHEAHEIVRGVQTRAELPERHGFGDEVGKLLGMGPPPVQPKPGSLQWPRAIKPLVRARDSTFYYEYLYDRGYTFSEIDDMAQLYGLRYATSGVFDRRVVIPVETKEEGLVSWTGRHIGSHPVRYRSLSPDPEKAAADFMPVALKAINHCLFNQVELETVDKSWPLLIVAEGPFDALSLDYFGYEVGMRGTCLFGLAVHDKQLDALAGIVDRFEHRLLLLDKGEGIAALTMAERLRPFGFRTMTSQTNKDPGAMTPNEIRELAHGALKA